MVSVDLCVRDGQSSDREGEIQKHNSPEVLGLLLL